MTQNASNIPDIEGRFQQPQNWRWGILQHKGRKLRYGASFPKDVIPDAVVVCLPGLSEFGEKYFELARNLNDRKMAFWVIDWAGQGKSDRYFEESPHKRHSAGFQQDVDDLHALYLEYIKHSSVHPDVGLIPRVMLAHSMGGNIGLHYLKQYPDTFDCAFFFAPMFGLQAFKKMPNMLAELITELIKIFDGNSYAAGQSYWRRDLRPSDGSDIFSSDPVRDQVHNAWSIADPALQVGGVTWRWIYEAVKSIGRLHNSWFLSSIKTHCVIATAGCDALVDNAAIKKVVERLPHATLIDFPEAQHELLMEKDEIRGPLLDAFQALVKERIIDNPEALQTF